MSFLGKNWLRTITIIGLFVTAGVAPFLIEQEIMPLTQLTTMASDFYNPLTGDFSIDNLLENIVGINILYSSPTQTAILITTKIINQPYNVYPMKIPAINIDLYFRAGRPYDRDKQMLQQFKADPDFSSPLEPWYDPLTVSWVRTMNILIPNELNVPVGSAGLLGVIVTLNTNGQEDNALSEMISTIIRDQGIPQGRLLAKGEVFFMGMPIPLSLEVPQFTLPTTGEGGGITDLLQSFFVDMIPETKALDFFHLADIRNYDDTNGNYFRDWNDTIQNGLKDQGENFTEPLLENGTISASVFLRMTDKLSIGGGMAEISPSPWNIQEGQNDSTGLLNYGDLNYWDTGKISDPYTTRYTPKPGIENTIWGTSDQQLLLYVPESLAQSMNKPEWRNRIIGVIGFMNDQTLLLDSQGSSIPLLLTADLKITGDARLNSNFTSGEAINSFIPQILNNANVSLGILGNIKVKLGQMPLSLVIKMELGQDISGILGSSSSGSQGLGALQNEGTSPSSLLGTVFNYLSLNNIMFNGLAMDVYNKIMQANASVGLDIFFPYGIYLPETAEEAEGFLSLQGGPIQIYNEPKPAEWDYLNETFPYNVPDVVINEDFESYANNNDWNNTPKWTITNQSNSNVTLTLNSGKLGSKGIIFKSNGIDDCSISKTFSDSLDISGFYFDVKLENTAGTMNAILLNGSSQIMNISIASSGDVSVNGISGSKINTGTNSWYRITVTTNSDPTGTFDVKIEGIVNEIWAGDGTTNTFTLDNSITSSDFENVHAINEEVVTDTFVGDNVTLNFNPSKTVSTLYSVMINETFDADGTTDDFTFKNAANTTGITDALVDVRAYNSTVTFPFSNTTNPSPTGGYEYTRNNKRIWLWYNNVSYAPPSDFKVNITYYVEEDNYEMLPGNILHFEHTAPALNAIISPNYFSSNYPVFTYTTAPSTSGGYQYTWNPAYNQVHLYRNGVSYNLPLNYDLFIEYDLGTVVNNRLFINNLAPTGLNLSAIGSNGEIYVDNVMFRNAKTLEEAQQKWYQDKLLFNITLETETLKNTFSQILAKIGSYRNGMGIAYHFNSRYLIGAYGTTSVGYYSRVLDNLFDTSTGYPIGTMPTGNVTIDSLRGLPTAKVPFEITLDDLRLNVKEIFPQFGAAFPQLFEDLGLNTDLISYLNNSLNDWGTSTGEGSGKDNTGTLADLLNFDVNQFLKFLYQPGAENDLFDFMVDEGFINQTYSALNLTALVEGIFNLVGAEDLMSGAGGAGGFDLFAMIPELLQASNINFDEILPNLIDYLIMNLSYESGIKPFELLDIAMTSTGTSTSDLVSGIDDTSWYIIFDNLKALLDIIDPMDLMRVAINNLLPFTDYLNRSGLLSESFVMPLIQSLFPKVETGEEFDWDKLFRNVVDLLDGLLFGVEIPDGVTQPWENKGLNLFEMIQSAESIQGQDPLTNQTLGNEEAALSLAALYNLGKGLEIFQSGEGNFIADTPPYNDLRLISNEALALSLIGFSAEDIYKLLADLGILDLTQLAGGGSSNPSEMFSGIGSLLSVLGMLAPPGEWISLLREMGIWSTWGGDWDMNVWVNIWGFITIPLDVASLLGPLVNLEKLLATGIMEVLPDFNIGGGGAGSLFDLGLQLSLNENQSYGNPYYYQAGYDTSSQSDLVRYGPYRQGLSGDSDDCDNWGWVPMGWDPGGSQYGSPFKNYTSDKGSAYPRDLLSQLIANLPIAIDIDIPEVDIPRTEILRFGIIFGDIVVDMAMNLPLDLSVRLRFEGNPSTAARLLETAGFAPLGFATHLYPDPNSWIMDMFGTFTGTGGSAPGEQTDMSYLDPILNNLDVFLQSFFISDLDLQHYVQFMLDPEFMPGSQWYLDPGYMKWDIVDNITGETIDNPVQNTLYWDYDYQANGYGNVTQTPYWGDGDGIPDEYPWYRFTLPSYNQQNPHRGPGTYLQADIYRYPSLIDEYTPLGYPGQGYWLKQPDGTPDGIQHYWYDTPYAFINTTPSASDPWPNINPNLWNDPSGSGSGYYQWTIGTTTYYWGESAPAHPKRPGFPYEQVPLVDIDDADWAPYANLWRGDASAVIPGGTNWGNPTVHPSIADINPNGYPNIWQGFTYALDQVDNRFGYWEKNTTTYSVDDKAYDYLNCLPFWTLLSLGVSPHLSGAIDFLDIPSMMTDVAKVATSNLGSDFWHQAEYNRTYRWFEPNWQYLDNKGFLYTDNASLGVSGLVTMPNVTTAVNELGNVIWTDYGNGTLKVWDAFNYYGDLYDVDLNPFGLLQWIWDGAEDIIKINDTGQAYPNKYDTYMTKYLAPYSIPNLQDAINWLADRGFTIDHILTILPKIIEEFSASGTGSSDMFSSLLSTETIVNFVKNLEDYYRRVPATINMTDWSLNHDPTSPNYLLPITQNRTRAAELILQQLSELPDILDINPTKVARGMLSYLMPRLGDIFGSGIGGEGGTTQMLESLSTMLHDSGLIDVIFTDTSKIRNLAFDFSIHNTVLNLTLFGWKFINIKLDDINLPLNITELGESMGNGGNGGGAGGLPISLPLNFASPLPYIELSTFNGPYEVAFQALNASPSSGQPIQGVDVSYGQVYYWQDPNDKNSYTYYFNVTMFNSPLSGWYNESLLPDVPPNAKLFVNNVTGAPGSLEYNMTHTNATGHVVFKGEIVEDAFGWVDPYLYVHVEPIDSPNVLHYWWNVTTISTQLTLAGHKEIQKARWVTPTTDNTVPNIVIQQATPFNSYVTDIDNDGLSEIFARVEIDNNTMDSVQKIFFMPNGSVESINAVHDLGYDVDLWADSHVVQNESWSVDGPGGQTSYTFSERVTPDGSSIIYPISPKVITGIQVNSGNWVDDSLTQAQIFYYDIEDTKQTNPIYLLNWNIRQNQSAGGIGGWVENLTGSNRISLLYGQTDAHPETITWSTSGFSNQNSPNASAGVILTYEENTYGGQMYTTLYRICDLDLFLTNISGANALKTLTSLQLQYYVYDVPEPGNYGTRQTITAYTYDGLAISPGSPFIINREQHGNPEILGYTNTGQSSQDVGYDLIWNGPYHRSTTGAKYANLSYVIPIPKTGCITEISWQINNTDDTSASGIQITNLSAHYAGSGPSDPNRGWKSITVPAYGGGGTYSGTIYSQTSVTGTYVDPWSPGYTHHLYLTSRGNDLSETWDYLAFEIRLQDDITRTGGYANLGWNDTDPALTNQTNSVQPVNVLIEIKSYEFVDSWGMSKFELPTGFISGFKLTAIMWDPQGNQSVVGPKYFYPNLTVSYKTVLKEDGTGLTNAGYLGTAHNNILTPAVNVRFVMEDSITNEDVTGGRGDALYRDADRTYGIIWNKLSTSNYPTVTTNASILDAESTYLITVNISANNALRNYYLNLTLPNSRGYIESKLGRLIVTSTNVDFQRKMGTFPPKAIIDIQNGYPHIYRLGTALDLDPVPYAYSIVYQLTFRVSASFLKDWRANYTTSNPSERFYFAAVWDKPIGTFESVSDRYIKGITVGPLYRDVRVQS